MWILIKCEFCQKSLSLQKCEFRKRCEFWKKNMNFEKMWILNKMWIWKKNVNLKKCEFRNVNFAKKNLSLQKCEFWKKNMNFEKNVNFKKYLIWPQNGPVALPVGVRWGVSRELWSEVSPQSKLGFDPRSEDGFVHKLISVQGHAIVPYLLPLETKRWHFAHLFWVAKEKLE